MPGPKPVTEGRHNHMEYLSNPLHPVAGWKGLTAATTAGENRKVHGPRQGPDVIGF